VIERNEVVERFERREKFSAMCRQGRHLLDSQSCEAQPAVFRSCEKIDDSVVAIVPVLNGMGIADLTGWKSA
jgi:hypothetical protein